MIFVFDDQVRYLVESIIDPQIYISRFTYEFLEVFSSQLPAGYPTQ